MEEIVVKHIADEMAKGDNYVESVFTVGSKEVIGHVDRLSLNPLRFLEYALVQQGIKIKKLVDGNDPWKIEELRIECNEYEKIERLLKEIMEYRCHPEHDLDWHNIIRQLPFDILMKTSDAIMNYGKSPEDIAIDKYNSNKRWREIASSARYELGESYARLYENGNPKNSL